MKQKNVLLTLPILLLLSQPCSMRAGVWDDIGKPLVGIGAVCAGVGGLIWLGSQLGHEDDDALLQRANDTYQRARQSYNPFILKVENYYDITDPRNAHTFIIQSLDEPLLYEMAGMLVRAKKNINPYVSDLQNTITQLNSLAQRLLERIRALRTESFANEATRELIEQMNRIRETIRANVPHLQLLHDYSSEHKTYFILFEREYTARQRYSAELAAASTGYQDHASMIYEIQRAIMNRPHNKYPYLEYIGTLEKDIENLQHALKKPAYAYADRISWVQWTVDYLIFIKNVVLATDAYAHEWYAHQQEKMHEEYMNALREKTEVEKQAVEALEKQNKLKQQELAVEQAKLHERYATFGK